jgi:hypothetical protein
LISSTQDRSKWANIIKGADNNTTRFDQIQATEIDQPKTDKDLVQLYFMKEDGTSKLQFRGTISGVTDTFNSSWAGYKYNGRADEAFQYQKFARSVSFNIQVYATSRIEMKPIWSKLGRLASHTMPNYVSNGYNGSLLNFTLGDLYSQELVFIDSLSYAMADDAPWDVSYLDSKNPIGELPMGVDVTIGLKILGKSEPTAYNKIYKY